MVIPVDASPGCPPTGALLVKFCSLAGAVWSIDQRPPSALFKVLLLGAHGVGKTALSRAMTNSGFSPEYRPGLEGMRQ